MEVHDTHDAFMTHHQVEVLRFRITNPSPSIMIHSYLSDFVNVKNIWMYYHKGMAYHH